MKRVNILIKVIYNLTLLCIYLLIYILNTENKFYVVSVYVYSKLFINGLNLKVKGIFVYGVKWITFQYIMGFFFLGRIKEVFIFIYKVQ